MEPEQIESIVLDNGLTLDILDYSRKIAADRWFVKLVARIEIAITDRGFSEKLPLPVSLDQLRDKLGPHIHHEYTAERNFVDQSEKASVLQNMLAGVLTKKSYYSHPSFGPRIIIKEYLAHRSPF